MTHPTTNDSPVFIVTGAASGIGRATAQRLASDGFKVLATDVNGQGLEATRAESGMPDSIATLVQDVAAAGAAEKAIDQAQARFGRFDGLVNNAGFGRPQPLHLTEDEEYDRFMNVLMKAVFAYSRAAVRAFGDGGGCIVQIASVFGLVGSHGASAYSAAKAGVIGLTRQMAVDYGPRGIRVNAIAPGLIRTGITQDRLAAGDERIRRTWTDATPFPRLGEPEDIAGAVSFLCSPSAGFINGHVLVVAGGWSATHYVPS